MKNLLAFAACTAIALLAAVTIHLATARVTTAEEKGPPEPNKAALARSRKLTQTLDNIFKQTIVLVTDKYVHDEDDFAAGSAAVLLFENISKSGDNKVKLLDATGEPYDPDNVARDAFERQGIKQLKGGPSCTKKW